MKQNISILLLSLILISLIFLIQRTFSIDQNKEFEKHEKYEEYIQNNEGNKSNKDNKGNKNSYKVGCIGFYDFENLFDTLDTEDVWDTEFTPAGRKGYTSEVYIDKLNRLATVVSQLGTDVTPDGVSILGICDIENRSVIEDFVKQDKVKDRNYQIVHYDSDDFRGIDVALIYNPTYFKVIESKIYKLDISSLVRKNKWKYTRDILYVYGLFDGDPMHFLVNHWPTRIGGKNATASLRSKGAKMCKEISDEIRAKDPLAKIIIMGNLNDGPYDDSVKKTLGGKKKKKKVGTDDFFNPCMKLIDKGQGSLAYRDSWNLFDQQLFSKGFISKKTDGYHYYKFKIFNKGYLKNRSGRYKGYPKRSFSFDTYNYGYSDHLPVYCLIVKKK